MAKIKKSKKRFYVLSANTINKEDIEVGNAYGRYEEIDQIRKDGQFQGQKTLKVQTLPGGHSARLTYFQDRKFIIKVERELVFLSHIPSNDTQHIRTYKKQVDIEASKKFLKYLQNLPKDNSKNNRNNIEELHYRSIEI